MLGVEARSSLPHDQHDGGNLPGQGQTRHLRSETLGQQSCVELLKRPRFDGGHNRRTLNQILQVMIAVSGFSPRMEICFFARSSCPMSCDQRCFVSRCQIRCTSITAALVRKRCGVCENRQAVRLPESDRSAEIWQSRFQAGVFSVFRSTDPAALPDVPSAAHTGVVGSKLSPPT